MKYEFTVNEEYEKLFLKKQFINNLLMNCLNIL